MQLLRRNTFSFFLLHRPPSRKQSETNLAKCFFQGISPLERLFFFPPPSKPTEDLARMHLLSASCVRALLITALLRQGKPLSDAPGCGSSSSTTTTTGLALRVSQPARCDWPADRWGKVPAVATQVRWKLQPRRGSILVSARRSASRRLKLLSSCSLLVPACACVFVPRQLGPDPCFATGACETSIKKKINTVS